MISLIYDSNEAQQFSKFALSKEGYGSKESLIAFFNEFYNKLKDKYEKGTEILVSPLKVSNTRKYKNKVFELLKANKETSLSDNELIALQMEI